jgi:metal-responsive CopG/Arc/MetJ family transcriptional regulator
MAKVMVSLPDDVLERVDIEARRRSTSRSALLTLAVRRELDRRDPAAVQAAIARSCERFRTVGVVESADLVRVDRDARA